MGSKILIVVEHRINFCNVVKYFAIEKVQRGRSHQGIFFGGRNWEERVQEVGNLEAPVFPCIQ